MNWKRITALILMALLLVLAACGETDTVPENKIEEEQTDSTAGSEQIDEPATEKNDTTASFPTTELQKKDEGEEVLKLQQALEEIGYNIPQDGIYSESLTWAITDFQLQTETLDVTGIYDEKTQFELASILEEEETIDAGAGLPPLAEPVSTDSGSIVLGNPYDQLAVVNKEQALPADYIPHDLVVPAVTFPFEEDLPKKQLRAPAARALEVLFEEALEAGHYLYAQSGYRSYERQVGLFEAYANEHGEEEANIFSARPGESEHQTGLSMDITSEAVGFRLTTDFGVTPEGIWVEENAHRFGFIIRYPEGKEAITEYQYEPWHLRYVGERAAEAIKENKSTLEEYFSEKE